MNDLLKRFIVEEEGQGLTEYALILGLVVFAIWWAVSESDIGASISSLFDRVAAVLDSCTGGTCGGGS